MPESMQGFDAELAVIGAAFIDPTAVERSGAQVTDFCEPRHRVVWAAVQGLRAQQQPIDTVTVGQALERAGKVDAAGGLDYLADLAEVAGSALNVAHHGKILRDCAQARRLRSVIAEAAKAVDEAWSDNGLAGVVEAISGVTDAAVRLMSGQGQEHSHTHAEAVRLATKRIQQAYESAQGRGLSHGQPWCFPHRRDPNSNHGDLDGVLPPLEPGELVTIAARTGGGKTVSGWQIAVDTALRSGRVTDYFTTEVDAAGMATRSIARHAPVDGLRLRTGALTDPDIDSLLKYGNSGAADVPVMLWDNPRQTIEYIAAMLRVVDAHRSEQERGGLVVLDYFQRIDSEEATRTRMDKTRRLEHVAQAAKVMAGQLRRPVLMLAQLRRDVEWGHGRKEDIEGSKKLGDESSAVIILRNADADLPDGVEHPEGYAEAFVAKSRNGATGRTIPMRFNGPHQVFETAGERWRMPGGRGRR